MASRDHGKRTFLKSNIYCIILFNRKAERMKPYLEKTPFVGSSPFLLFLVTALFGIYAFSSFLLELVAVTE